MPLMSILRLARRRVASVFLLAALTYKTVSDCMCRVNKAAQHLVACTRSAHSCGSTMQTDHLLLQLLHIIRTCQLLLSYTAN